MRIKAGFRVSYECSQPTPMLLCLSVHPSRLPDLLTPQRLLFSPDIPAWDYVDGFGNICTRIVAPSGIITVSTAFEINDTGRPDFIPVDAVQHEIKDLPDDTLVYLLGSRYCETDRLSDIVWKLFAHTQPGCPRVHAILDFVHNHISFGYEHARSTMTAFDVFTEGKGVCRDFAHLAIAFCRCMNIPARYCTGYLSDYGTPLPYPDGDFAAWFEAWIGGRWQIFDPRNNVPRVGRILMARGRDACDVAITTTFGPNTLEAFKVWTDEITTRQITGTAP